MPKNKAKSISLSKIYNEVARRADTEGVKINVAETKRVIACFFDMLNECPASEALRVIAKGLQRASSRKR